MIYLRKVTNITHFQNKAIGNLHALHASCPWLVIHRFWAYLNILGELGGGLSLAFGFLTPLGAAGVFGAMLFAIASAHWKNGFFNSKRGIEFPLALLTVATAIGIAGPGAISLDQLFGIHLPYLWLFVILAIIAILVDLVGLAIKRANSAAGAATHAPA